MKKIKILTASVLTLIITFTLVLGSNLSFANEDWDMIIDDNNSVDTYENYYEFSLDRIEKIKISSDPNSNTEYEINVQEELLEDPEIYIKNSYYEFIKNDYFIIYYNVDIRRQTLNFYVSNYDNGDSAVLTFTKEDDEKYYLTTYINEMEESPSYKIKLKGNPEEIIYENIETFEDFKSTSYNEYYFDSKDHVRMTLYNGRSSTPTYNIDGSGVILQNAIDSKLEMYFPKGVVDLSFDYKKAYTSSNDRQLELLVDGVSYKIFSVIKNDDVYTERLTLNINEPTTITIKNVGSTAAARQFILNNIKWNSGSAALEDYTRPAIDGNEIFVTNVDNPDLVQTFVSELKAIDDIDGDISDKIIIEEDNYSNSKSSVGEYTVKVSATDSAGNKSTFTFKVVVADVTAPTLSAITSKTFNYTQKIELSTLQNEITVTDNYYSRSELTLIVKSDTYSTNYNKPGNYIVLFEAEDPSGNKATINFNIKVVDLEKPVFNGVGELTKSYTKILTLSEIIKDIKATDAIDGDLTSKITVQSDNFTGKGDIPGAYEIVLSVKDNSGNKATHIITVTVIDDKSADWFITNGVTINLVNGANLTRQQIINLLSKTGNIDISPESIVVYSVDTYSDNTSQPGAYQLAFTVKQQSGSEESYSFNINVLSSDDSDSDKTPSATIIEKVKKYFEDNKITLIVIGSVLLVLVTSVGFTRKFKSTKGRRR